MWTQDFWFWMSLQPDWMLCPSDSGYSESIWVPDGNSDQFPYFFRSGAVLVVIWSIGENRDERKRPGFWVVSTLKLDDDFASLDKNTFSGLEKKPSATTVLQIRDSFIRENYPDRPTVEEGYCRPGTDHDDEKEKLIMKGFLKKILPCFIIQMKYIWQ